VIDAAQDRLAGMAAEMISLKDILANKQARGAFGQGRWRPSSRTACARRLRFPDDAVQQHPARLRDPPARRPRPLVVDSKFPLEGIAQFRAARDDEARKLAARRVRAHVTQHVDDIANKYLLAGETQDVALMFVPSESVYADLVEHFDDVVQRAHRARVVIVSPR